MSDMMVSNRFDVARPFGWRRISFDAGTDLGEHPSVHPTKDAPSTRSHRTPALHREARTMRVPGAAALRPFRTTSDTDTAE